MAKHHAVFVILDQTKVMTNQHRRAFIASFGQMVAAVCVSFALQENKTYARTTKTITVDRNKAGLRAGEDCTSLIQHAIDVVSESGGEVMIPVGDYLIDPVVGLKLRSNVSLTMSHGVILRARPTIAPNYAILRILDATNVCVRGGSLMGERGEHLGSVGEWGMGIDIRGSRAILIEGVKISNCWGDGIYIGSSSKNSTGTCSNITISGVVCENNRRQGLTIVSCSGALIANCEFIGTNGTSPSAGVDIEPNRGQVVRDVRIVDCKALRNAGDGFMLTGNAAGSLVSGCQVVGGVSSGNRGFGVSLWGAVGLVVKDMDITDNDRHGIYVNANADGTIIADNHISGNELDQKVALLGELRSSAKGELIDGVFIQSGARGTKISTKSVGL